jgi:hypothetical protein
MLERGTNHPDAYKSMFAGLRHVYITRGLRGLWAGFTPSTLGVAHGAVQFAIYEKMKHRRGEKIGGQQRLSNWDYIYMSGGSKLLAGAITYPYQPIRARMQQYDAGSKYTGLVDVLRKTYRNEGFLAFYKGYVAELRWVALGKRSLLMLRQSHPEHYPSRSNYCRHVCCLREHETVPADAL